MTIRVNEMLKKFKEMIVQITINRNKKQISPFEQAIYRKSKLLIETCSFGAFQWVVKEKFSSQFGNSIEILSLI